MIPAAGAAILPAMEVSALSAAMTGVGTAAGVTGATGATGAASAANWMSGGSGAIGQAMQTGSSGAPGVMGGGQPHPMFDAVTAPPPNTGNLWNQARNMKPEDIAKLAEEPGFWSKFGKGMKGKGQDFLKGAKSGAGKAASAMGRMAPPQMGSGGHSFSPVGNLPGAFQSGGGLSAIARAIAGRG